MQCVHTDTALVTGVTKPHVGYRQDPVNIGSKSFTVMEGRVNTLPYPSDCGATLKGTEFAMAAAHDAGPVPATHTQLFTLHNSPGMEVIMSMHTIPVFTFGLAGLAITVSSLLYAQVKPIPVTVSDQAGERENTQVMMQAKLGHSQKVLEGLVTQDFEAIEKAAAALSKISLSPPPDLTKAGDKSDEQVYEHFRMEFARLSGQLEGHARRKELEATAYVQQNLTATCIACHDYIRDYP